MPFDPKQRLLKHSLQNNCSKNIQEQHNFFFEYEATEYKQDKIIEIIDRYITDYALSEQEIAKGLCHVDAWKRIYAYKVNKTKNNEDRISGGMFGEAILYNILKNYFPQAKKMVTKIRKRTTNKMEINGFDCAHYEFTNGKLILWLGESKFYNNFSKALEDAYASLIEHLTVKKIKDEFVRLSPDLEISNSEEKKIIEGIMNGTLDDIEFVVPVLLTYDSKVPQQHTSKPDFVSNIQDDYMKKWEAILSKKFDEIKTTITTKFKFILLPFSDVGTIKKQLVSKRDTY